MTTTRRNFLKGAAASGIVFCGCGLQHGARAQPGAARLPVKVGGKRVMTVDAHTHCYFHEALNLMGDAADKVLPPVKGVPEHFIVIEQRLKEMDAMAIDMEILSINPFWYGKDRDTAAAIVKVNNEKLAELCASRPDRFGAFASLSLQFPDLAVQQLETAIKKQGLRGAAIGGSVMGEDFSDPKFHPVWAKAEELGAVLFIHPQSTPELAKRLAQSRPDMKVLCMSGYTDDSIVRHGVLEATMAFLQKPITMASLTAKVREVLDAPVARAG